MVAGSPVFGQIAARDFVQNAAVQICSIASDAPNIEAFHCRTCREHRLVAGQQQLRITNGWAAGFMKRGKPVYQMPRGDQNGLLIE